MMNEVKALKLMNSELVIKLFEVIETQKQVILVLEWFSQTLLEYINKKPQKFLNELEAKVILKQLVRAVSYIHSKNIIHNDLKLENILIND